MFMHVLSEPSDGGSHLALECDVGSSESVQQSFINTLHHFKQPPSLLANCGGIVQDTFLTKMSEKQFDSVINVNLKVG